jgi:hypothetical protein
MDIYVYMCVFWIYIYMCVYENRSKPMKLPSNGKNNRPLTIKNENLLVLRIRTMIEQQLFGLDVGSIYY